MREKNLHFFYLTQPESLYVEWWRSYRRRRQTEKTRSFTLDKNNNTYVRTVRDVTEKTDREKVNFFFFEKHY